MNDLALEFLPDARADLLDIWAYSAKQWGEEQADRYLRCLNDCFQHLRTMPYGGKAVTAVRKDVRVLACKHHFIFYSIQNKSIVIVAIYHEKMDAIRHLMDRLR